MRRYSPTKESISTIPGLISKSNQLQDSSGGGSWIYRGEGFRKEGKGEEWTLKSSLERAAERFDLQSRSHEIEHWILNEFKRRAHHHVSHLPETWDTMQWLSLMQHHGSPTRLLDWTYSPFVAAFNALQSVTKDTEAIVWSCKHRWLGEQSKKRLRKAGLRLVGEDPFLQDGTPTSSKTFSNAFRINGSKPRKALTTFVYPVNSFRLNERQTIQQGVFLACGDVNRPFQENLDDMNPGTENFRLWKLEKGPGGEFHRKMLLDLIRMNVNEAVLYPGLDGFSRSLKLGWKLLGGEPRS